MLFLTATSGQDSVVAPNGTGLVYFSINFNQKGGWYFYGGGTVDIT